MNYNTPNVKVIYVDPRKGLCVSPGMGTEGFNQKEDDLDLGEDWD